MIKPEIITITFILIFLSVQTLGIYIGFLYNQAVQEEILEPIISNPENITNSLYLFGYILAATAAIILILKFRRSLLKLIEIIILFVSSWITFDFLFPIVIWYIDLGLILAIVLTVWKIFRPGMMSHILAIVFSLSGIGALLGASLGILPVIVFILLLSVYDFVSVFITKHMVFMAKSIVKEPTIFVVSVPSTLGKTVKKRHPPKLVKARVFNLGSGDVVLPLIFITSLLVNFGLKHAIFSLVGVTIVLFLLLNWRIKETLTKPRALPVMPFLSMGLFAGFLLALVV